MSASSHSTPSQNSRRSPPHTPDVPSSPEQTAVEEVAAPPLPTSFPLTLVTTVNDEEEEVPALVELQRDEYPPVSPGTAETIIALDPLFTTDPTISATVRATALGLVSTIRMRTAEFAQKLHDAEHKIARQEAIIQQRTADNRQLRARLGVITVPDGFERNQGRVTAAVPTEGGRMVVPEWIRSVGNGRVELLAGREPGEPTYVAELFLRPNYTENAPTDTAAPWFTALITSRDGSFHTLVEAARRLDNPAVVAEIYRYRDLDRQRNELTHELNRVSDALTSLRDGLDSCRCRLEWAQVPVLLQHLQDRMSFAPAVTSTVHVVGRRRRNPRRLRVDDGASS